jgi:hypothetical protein
MALGRSSSLPALSPGALACVFRGTHSNHSRAASSPSDQAPQDTWDKLLEPVPAGTSEQILGTDV